MTRPDPNAASPSNARPANNEILPTTPIPAGSAAAPETASEPVSRRAARVISGGRRIAARTEEMDAAEELAAQEHAEQLAREELEQHSSSTRPGKRAAAKAAKAAAAAANAEAQAEPTPEPASEADEDLTPAEDTSTSSTSSAPSRTRTAAGRRAGTASADDAAPRSTSGRRVAPAAAATPLATTPAAYSAHASNPGDPKDAAPSQSSAGTSSAGKATPGKQNSGSASGSGSGSGSAKAGSGAGQAQTPTRRPRLTGRGLGKKAFGAMAFLFVAGMAVATSLPAQAHLAMNPGSAPIQSVVAESIDQSLTTETSAQAAVSRDSYGVTIPVVSAAVAAVSGSVSSFGNPALGAIQWPLPGGTPISDGFGARSSPGGIGSTNHMGMDFDPGSGTPIHAVADGVVTIAQKSDNGGLGCYVEIAHNVNGLSFSSVYGHMQCATVSMSQGETVSVTQLVGLVGSTGTSTGAHLHFEIHNSSGTPVDPDAWMRANAG